MMHDPVVLNESALALRAEIASLKAEIEALKAERMLVYVVTWQLKGQASRGERYAATAAHAERLVDELVAAGNLLGAVYEMPPMYTGFEVYRG